MTAATAPNMAELRAHTGSLYIRNNTPFLWTLHETVGQGRRIDLELKPAGQPDSITYLPADALDAPGVARNIAAGKVTVSPDLENDMLDLMAQGSCAKNDLLAQYQVKVEESPNARAIDVRGDFDKLMENVERKRIKSQAEQSLSDFTLPDSAAVDPSPTEIKSVTVTRPFTANPEEN